MPLGLDAYIRVSRVGKRQGPSFISPEVQREQIENWARLREAQILEWHVDLDQSGARMERPGFDAMLARVDRGDTGGVVVAKIDRFARSLPGALEAINRIEVAGGEFVSVQDGIDPSTPAGKMLHRLLLVLAEFELDRIRENWRIARRQAVERGVQISPYVLTGYRRPHKGASLEPDPDVAPVIGELFRRRAAGASWRELADVLEAAGARTPTGGQIWRAGTVRQLIANRTFLGEARHGDLAKLNAHHALVDRDTFEAAQRTRGVTPPRGEPTLLAGLIRCSGCRYAMAGGRDKSGFFYRCKVEHAAGRCASRAMITGPKIDSYVEAAFFELAGERTISATQRGDDLTAARVDAAAAEAELTAYRDDERIAGALGRDRYVDGLEKRVEVAELAHGRVVELQGAGPELPDATTLRALWEDLSVLERRKLLHAAIDCVFVRSGRAAIEDRVVVVAKGDGPTDLPGRGRRTPLEPFVWPN